MEGLLYINEHLHSCNAINQIVKFITRLGDGGFFWIALAIILLFFKKTRVPALVMLCSLAVGYLLNDYVFKAIFSRPRPFAKHPEILEFLKSINLSAPGGYSFPSGHAFSSFNCAMTLALFDKKLGAFGFVMASLIGLSRIFMCVHYPTDVLAGMILGILTAVCVFVIFKSIIRVFYKQKRKSVRNSDKD